MRSHQTKKLINNKANNQQSEKTTYRWEKIFVNHISDNGLICIIHRNSNNLIFCKGDIEMANTI
jgi:hypothetical protein